MCRRPSVRVTRCVLHQPEAQRANASLTSGYIGSESVWWALPEHARSLALSLSLSFSLSLSVCVCVVCVGVALM